ncbi:hypothetical protein GN956_G21407 [Arapaima gigas]
MQIRPQFIRKQPVQSRTSEAYQDCVCGQLPFTQQGRGSPASTLQLPALAKGRGNSKGRGMWKRGFTPSSGQYL